MKRVIVIVLVCLLGFLIGCSSQPSEFNITVPDTLRPESKDIVTNAWPKVKALCPGLNKYASSLKFEKIADNFDYAAPHAQRVTISFLVADGKPIPADYGITDDIHCFVEISRDGQRLSVPKTGCRSVALDRVVAGSQGDTMVLSPDTGKVLASLSDANDILVKTLCDKDISVQDASGWRVYQVKTVTLELKGNPNVTEAHISILPLDTADHNARVSLMLKAAAVAVCKSDDAAAGTLIKAFQTLAKEKNSSSKADIGQCSANLLRDENRGMFTISLAAK